MNIFLLLLNLILFYVKSYEFVCASFNQPILLVIAIDGLQLEHITKENTPNLYAFKNNGVYVKNMKTLKYSNAFEAFHTIATGRHPSKHGVMGHKYFAAADSEKNTPERSVKGYEEMMYSYDKTIYPIWSINQFNGGRSGCALWPGCEFVYGNEEVSNSALYKDEKDLLPQKTFEKVIKWLNDSATPSNLIMIYLHSIDKFQHSYGPNSPHMQSVYKEIDDAQGYLYTKLKELNLYRQTNIIYVSDHSMESVKYSDLKSVNKIYEENCGPNQEQDNFINSGQFELSVTNDENEKRKCHGAFNNNKEDFTKIHDPNYPPEPDFNINAESNTCFVTQKGKAFLEYLEQHNYIKVSENKSGLSPPAPDTLFGSHSFYSNKAVLIAQGSVFTTGLVDTPIQMVDLFKLFTYILRIPGNHQRDGNFSRVVPLLRQRSNDMINWPITISIIAIIAIIHCIIFYFGVNFYLRKKDEFLLKKKKAMEASNANDPNLKTELNLPGPSLK